jgi:hypothetical protein
MRFITMYKSGMWAPLNFITFLLALRSGNVRSWKLRLRCGYSTPGEGIPTTPPPEGGLSTILTTLGRAF